MKLKSKVIPSGNATAVEIPGDALASLGGGPRPAVTIAINGHRWRTRVALMRGLALVGVSARNRAEAGIAEGDIVEFSIALDEEPREVDEPDDLRQVFDAHPAARTAFNALPFGLRQKHVRHLDEAKSADTRRRRLAKLVDELARRAV